MEELYDVSSILTPSSPELAKKDRSAMANTFKTSVDTLEILRSWGVYTENSMAVAGQNLAKEFLDITLEIEESVTDDTEDTDDTDDTDDTEQEEKEDIEYA